MVGYDRIMEDQKRGASFLLYGIRQLRRVYEKKLDKHHLFDEAHIEEFGKFISKLSAIEPDVVKNEADLDWLIELLEGVIYG